MSEPPTINISVKIQFRLPEPGETLPVYCEQITKALSRDLEETLEAAFGSFVASWEAGEMVARPLKPGRFEITFSNGETFVSEGDPN